MENQLSTSGLTEEDKSRCDAPDKERYLNGLKELYGEDFCAKYGDALYQTLLTTLRDYEHQKTLTKISNTSTESLTEKQLKEWLRQRVITRTNEKIETLQSSGILHYGEGLEQYNIPSQLTVNERNQIKKLEEKDITDIKIFVNMSKEEQYIIITYKEKGIPYTTIQVPQWLRKMKYGETHIGSQLANYKDQNRGV
jgi:hypothetical protein